MQNARGSRAFFHFPRQQQDTSAPAPVHQFAPRGLDLHYLISAGFHRPYPTTRVYSHAVLSFKKCARPAHRPRDVVQQIRALRLRSVQVGLDVATSLFSVFPGSRVPMRMLSRADDAMGWLPRATTGSSEAIGAVPRSPSPCRRPGWGSQVGGLRSSHARRFRRRWCNWGHNAPCRGLVGGPRKRAWGGGTLDATHFKLWREGCRSPLPATFELGTAGGGDTGSRG